MRPLYIAAAIFFLLTPFTSLTVTAGEFSNVPMAYKGRFRPAEVAAQLWLHDIYHRHSLSSADAEAAEVSSPLELLWRLHLEGYRHFANVPLFFVQQANLKQLLGIEMKKSRFSYHELTEKFNNNTALANNVLRTSYTTAYNDPRNRGRSTRLELSDIAPGLWVDYRNNDLRILKAPTSGPWKWLSSGQTIASNYDPTANTLSKERAMAQEALNLIATLQQFSLSQRSIPSDTGNMFQRLKKSGTNLLLLPSKSSPGEWLPIGALAVESRNFTAYPDPLFNKIATAYEDTTAGDPLAYGRLAAGLKEGYLQLAGTTARHAQDKALHYPAIWQLHLESFYYQYPLPLTAAILYAIALIALIIRWKSGWYTALTIAFFLHTATLSIRIAILGRPPVSNMFETVLYVPWIAIIVGAFFNTILHNRWVLPSATIATIPLMTLLHVTALDSGMENVQAVLDSQYWLTIHVLMIVGSYGVFAVSAILGHLYLGIAAFRKDHSPLPEISKAMLATMYLGVGLLIPGTILGGVWAAESWGRFWDWDPKESWAFISSCVYLIAVHLHRFGFVRSLGLAVGAIIGFTAISFTWYGVNYILGTGLHAYGFGSGGEIGYFTFLISEMTFIIVGLLLAKKKNIITS